MGYARPPKYRTGPRRRDSSAGRGVPAVRGGGGSVGVCCAHGRTRIGRVQDAGSGVRGRVVHQGCVTSGSGGWSTGATCAHEQGGSCPLPAYAAPSIPTAPRGGGGTAPAGPPAGRSDASSCDTGDSRAPHRVPSGSVPPRRCDHGPSSGGPSAGTSPRRAAASMAAPAKASAATSPRWIALASASRSVSNTRATRCRACLVATRRPWEGPAGRCSVGTAILAKLTGCGISHHGGRSRCRGSQGDAGCFA